MKVQDSVQFGMEKWSIVELILEPMESKEEIIQDDIFNVKLAFE